jgi:hypothetical protein
MLAFENNEIEDYVTEKLINAYQAGTVPIYMGSPNSSHPSSLFFLPPFPQFHLPNFSFSSPLPSLTSRAPLFFFLLLSVFYIIYF